MIERGSDIEALLMLCALADPEEARAWLYHEKGSGGRMHLTCPLSSAGNNIAGERRWGVEAGYAAEYMGSAQPATHCGLFSVIFAADNSRHADHEVRAALEAMFPKEKNHAPHLL